VNAIILAWISVLGWHPLKVQPLFEDVLISIWELLDKDFFKFGIDKCAFTTVFGEMGKKIKKMIPIAYRDHLL
jgi:hypothetical protein